MFGDLTRALGDLFNTLIGVLVEYWYIAAIAVAVILAVWIFFDDLSYALEEYWYIAVGAVAVIAVAGAAYSGAINLEDLYPTHDKNSSGISVEIVGDEGITDPYGDGKYSPGGRAELSVRTHIGWFFRGWYDSQGNLLSEDTEYVFYPTESCKIYAKTERGYGMNLYKTVGIERMTGGGTYGFDEDATVSAAASAGYTFDGWYDIGGEKVSSFRTLTVSEHRDRVLIAKTTASNPYLGGETVTIGERTQFAGGGTFMVLMDDRTGDVVEASSGNQGWSVSLVPGQYELVVKGTKTDGLYGSEYRTFLVDGISSNVYHWTFGGKAYSLTWDLDTSVYRDYTQHTFNRSPQTANDCLSYINYNSRNVQIIAGKLNEMSTGMTDLDRADFVLKFVQLCTEYELDRDYNGHTEYWKYPLETLFEGRGDCEDTSILYCALMKAMGYDTALLLYMGAEYMYNGHAAASVALDSCPGGTYYEKNGLRFYYCETTSDTKNVGDIWTNYDRGQVIVVR